MVLLFEGGGVVGEDRAGDNYGDCLENDLCEQGEGGHGEGNGNGPHAVLSSKVVAEDGAQVDGNGDGDGGGDGGGDGDGDGGGGGGQSGGGGGSGSTWIPGPDAFEAGVKKAKKSLVLHVIPGKYWIYHIYIFN